MRCYARLEAWLSLAILFFLSGFVQAADFGVDGARLDSNDGGYVLSADFRLNLNRRLEDAVNKGVVLYFTVDFELVRSRWYWFDEKRVQRSKTTQLFYHALTRQYRLTTGALHQSFVTLEEALHVLSRVRYWQVIDAGDISGDGDYLAATRIRLDPSLMPKTFQVSALSSRDWNQSSDWLRWKFSATDTAAAAESPAGEASVTPHDPAAPPFSAPGSGR